MFKRAHPYCVVMYRRHCVTSTRRQVALSQTKMHIGASSLLLQQLLLCAIISTVVAAKPPQVRDTNVIISLLNISGMRIR